MPEKGCSGLVHLFESDATSEASALYRVSETHPKNPQEHYYHSRDEVTDGSLTVPVLTEFWEALKEGGSISMGGSRSAGQGVSGNGDRIWTGENEANHG